MVDIPLQATAVVSNVHQNLMCLCMHSTYMYINYWYERDTWYYQLMSRMRTYITHLLAIPLFIIGLPYDHLHAFHVIASNLHK